MINSTRGDTSFFQRGALNTALVTGLAIARPIINAKLAEGLPVNDIVQGIFGTILYVEEMEIVPADNLMIARLTPAFNFTWTCNATATPHTVDLRPYE